MYGRSKKNYSIKKSPGNMWGRLLKRYHALQRYGEKAAGGEEETLARPVKVGIYRRGVVKVYDRCTGRSLQDGWNPEEYV